MRAIACCVVLIAALPTLAAAQAAPSRERVRQLLSGIEDVPSDAQWRRLGDGVLPVLIDLYASPTEAPFVRLRAVGAVGAFPWGAVRTFLLAVARVDGQSDLFVREAVVTLARAFGAEALGDLLPFLDHGEPVVREATVVALGAMRTARVNQALRERLRIEREPLVRAALSSALR